MDLDVEGDHRQNFHPAMTHAILKAALVLAFAWELILTFSLAEGYLLPDPLRKKLHLRLGLLQVMTFSKSSTENFNCSTFLPTLIFSADFFLVTGFATLLEDLLRF
jgi:hypothetical protein